MRRPVARLHSDGDLSHLPPGVGRGGGGGGADVDQFGLDVVGDPREGPGDGPAELSGGLVLTGVVAQVSLTDVRPRHAGRDPVQVHPGGGAGAHHDGGPRALDHTPRGPGSQHGLDGLLGLVRTSWTENFSSP